MNDVKIPDEAKATVPWGFEIKVGDGVWVKQKGCLCWTELESTASIWDSLSLFHVGRTSVVGSIYALPVVLDGYELVKVGDVVPAAYKCRPKNTILPWRDYCRVIVPSEKTVSDADAYWYMRPIAAPVVETQEPVKCPFCGRGMEWDIGLNRYACACAFTTPKCCSMADALALLKRLTVATEPLRCPVCGSVNVHTDAWIVGMFKTACQCGVSGQGSTLPVLAEESFRKLTYGGEA